MKKLIKYFKNCLRDKKTNFILLSFLVLFWVSNNFFWITSDPLNNIFCGKDWQTHIRNYSNFLDFLRNIEIFSSNRHSFIYKCLFIDLDYPPVYYWTSLFLQKIFGWLFIPSVLFTSTFFLIILIVIIYKIGECLRQGSGLLSAFICSFFPVIYKSSLFYNLELATATAVAGCIYLIFKTEMFKNRGYAILTGIFLGIGMLIKYTFGLFLIGPLIALFIDIYTASDASAAKKEQKINIVLCLIIGGIITMFYYYNPLVTNRFFVRCSELPEGLKDLGVLNRFFYYIKSFVFKGTGLLFFLASIFPCVVFFKTKNNNKLIYLWIGVPFLFLSLGPYYYQYEYLIPLVPAAALITAAGVLEIRHCFLRRLMVLTLISACLIQGVVINEPGFRSLFFSKDCDSHEIYSIFKHMGQEDTKVGFITDKQTLKYFYGVKPFLAVCSNNRAKVDTFLISDFDHIIYPKYDFIICAFNAVQEKDKELLNRIILENKNISMSSIVFFPFYGYSMQNVWIEILSKKNTKVNHKTEKADSFYICQIRNYFALYQYVKISRTFRAMGYDILEPLLFLHELLSQKELFFGNYATAFNEIVFLSRKYRETLQYEKAFKCIGEMLCNDLSRDQNFSVRIKNIVSMFFYKSGVSDSFAEIDEVFIALKNPQKAIIFFKELVLLYPDNKDINLRLARQYKILQDYENSRKYFKVVLKIDQHCDEAILGINYANRFLPKADK